MLGNQVKVMLARTRIARPANDSYVIRGRKTGGRLVNLQKPWQRIRALDGLADVHLQDLRHSYAGTVIGSGQDIRIVGAQLGHTQLQTTMRYAHVAQDPLWRATDQVSGVIAGFMTKDDRGGEI